MKFELVDTRKGKITSYSELDARLDTISSFLDLLAGTRTDTLAIPRDSLPDDFFRLSTGLAGEMLQKVSNYRRRLIILGDFKNVTSTSLRDFVRESNATGQVVFAGTFEEGVKKLR